MTCPGDRVTRAREVLERSLRFSLVGPGDRVTRARRNSGGDINLQCAVNEHCSSVHYKCDLCQSHIFPPLTLFPWCDCTNIHGVCCISDIQCKFHDVEGGATDAGHPRWTAF